MINSLHSLFEIRNLKLEAVSKIGNSKFYIFHSKFLRGKIKD